MAAVEEMSFAKKMSVVKLVLSSLFARKQDFLVVDGNVRNKLFYTNLSAERVIFYKPDIDDTLHEVKLSEEVARSFYDILPLLKDVICIIHLPTLLKTMNKRLAEIKGQIPDLCVDSTTGQITMTCPPDKAEQVYKMLDGQNQSNFMTVVVGQLITEDIFVKYEEIVANFMSFMKEPVERTVVVSSAVGDDKFILNSVEVDNTVYNCSVSVNAPIADGFSVVSYKEYLSKRKLPWRYKMLVMYNPKRSVAKVAYEHKDDMVEVLSILPGTLWFPFSKR